MLVAEFLNEKGVEWSLRISKESFIVELQAMTVERSRSVADELVDVCTDFLALSAAKLNLRDARVRWSRRKGHEHRIPAIWASASPGQLKKRQLGGTMSFSQTQSTTERFIWFGGTVIITESLEYELRGMMETETPMGLILPDRNIQIGLNPASVRLFGLSQIEEGVQRDTSSDWFPEDLQRKHQAIRDAGDGPFEILARIRTKNGWLLMRNQYRFIENRSLLIATGVRESDLVPTPEALVVV